MTSHHTHRPAETYRDASDGGYTLDRCACGATRVTAWSKHTRADDDGKWGK